MTLQMTLITLEAHTQDTQDTQDIQVKARKGASASPAAAAAASIVCESVNDIRQACFAPVGVALAASVNFDNDLDYYDDADDVAPRENIRSWLVDTGCKTT